MTSMVTVLGLVERERARQELLKREGRFPATCADDVSDLRRLAILTEEFLEVLQARMLMVAQLVNDEADGKPRPEHLAHLRAELVQVAAVCVAWREAL
jgi:hypothetical protein